MSGGYELLDGTVLAGLSEAVCRRLDASDPLSDTFRSDTDSDTARLLAEASPETRWCEEAQRLVVSTGLDSYREAPPERLGAMCAEVARARLAWARDAAERARGEGDDARAKALGSYAGTAKRLCSNAAVTGAAKSFKLIAPVGASELNTEPTALGTPDGVLDLDDGGLRSDAGDTDAKEWRVTKCTRGRVPSMLYPGAGYDGRWDEFVLEIMCGDEERADYLQRALGYSILGDNPEECMFVAYGATARNGKGTLMESVAWALGEYAATVDHDYLVERRGGSAGGADEETASLDGVRLVTISEPTKGRRLDEARVKMLTGGDSISCRHLFGRQFTYRPQFTMWLSCNRLPVVGDATVLSSGRIRVIPFERHFEESERDPGLKERFRTELGACTVLTWLVEGYLAYRERGLDEPACVKKATRSYAEVGGSTLSRFVDECCTLRQGLRMQVGDFNESYRAWCASADEPPLTAQRVRREFEEMGVPKRRSDGRNFYDGIELNGAGLAWLFDEGEGRAATSKTGSPGSAEKPKIRLA